MDVNDIVQARIAAARMRIEANRRRRAAQQAARDKGLARRHAAKLRAQANPRRPQAVDKPTKETAMCDPRLDADGEPVHPCRIMPTRPCPESYKAQCGDRPCARFESEDPAPWLPAEGGQP